MIVYYKNNEIDRELWDNCVRFTHGAKPYAYSWYLDIMAPGWEALVDDDYDSVFPVPCSILFGIQYVSTPKYIQQLGAFSPDKPVSMVIEEFVDYMPDFYKLTNLLVGQKTYSDKYKVTEKENFELDLSSSYETLWNGFTSNCKRNIAIAEKKKLEISSDISSDELMNLFIRSRGFKIRGIKNNDIERLMNLMNYCLKKRYGKILGVRSSKKRLLFGLFLIQIPGSITFILSSNTPEGRAKQYMYFVVNKIIKENASSKTILDFTESSIPSIASLLKSFGGIKVPYFRIYRNRLFWPSRIMK